MEEILKQPSAVDFYETILVPGVFRPLAMDLVERARPIGPSARVLDLGCGTGIVARVLHERLGGGTRISGLDLNELMVAKARTLAPDIDFRQGDAARMPFESGAFELVLSQAMLQFVPDKVAALREVRRVLTPGGHLVLSVARARSEQPLVEALGAVAERYFGKPNDPRYAFSDPEALRAMLEEVGFGGIGVEPVSLSTRFGDFPVRMEVIAGGYDLSGLSDAERERRLALYETDARKAIAPFATDGGYATPSSLNIATATKK